MSTTSNEGEGVSQGEASGSIKIGSGAELLWMLEALRAKAANADESGGRLLRNMRFAKKHDQKTVQSFIGRWQIVMDDLNKWAYNKHGDPASCKDLGNGFDERAIRELRGWDADIKAAQNIMSVPELCEYVLAVLKRHAANDKPRLRTNTRARRFFKRYTACRLVYLME